MGKFIVQPKPTNIPRLPRVSKVSTRSLRGGRPPFHRNLLLCQNASPSQEGPNQARLETESYETMVQHLEREIERNGLATTHSTSITGIHNIEPSLKQQQQQNKPPKTTGTCFGCGNPGHLLRNCRKTNRDKRSQRNNTTAQASPCETCGKMSHETKDCYSGANWENRPTWWKTPKTTPPNNIPIAQHPQTIPMQQPQTAPMSQPLTVTQPTNESKNF